jgi:hypothetical protein
MFGSIAIFALMTFIIWGWVLLWPISKIKREALKGNIVALLVLILLGSLIATVAYQTSANHLTVASISIKTWFADIFRGNPQMWFWITLAVGYVISFVLSLSDSLPSYRDNSQTEHSVSNACFSTYCVIFFAFGVVMVSFVLYVICYKGIYMLWLMPLFKTLFLSL